MPLTGFEPAIPASERLQKHAFDRVVTGIGCLEGYGEVYVLLCLISHFRRGIHEVFVLVDLYAALILFRDSLSDPIFKGQSSPRRTFFLFFFDL